MSRRKPAPLPLLDQPPAERADAARNRQRLVDAAQRIVAAKGVAGLALDEVARAAGVGVGTAYRRFGDVSGLAYTLLEEAEVRFQEAFLAGPAPLGPGAGPEDRVRAFVHALLDLQEEQWDLRLLASVKTPHGYAGGPYSAYHLHLANLLAAAHRDLDPRYAASALLALMQPSLLDHQRRTLGLSLEQIRAGLDRFVAGLLDRP
ncbi:MULTISPECIES: TetR/AcrR family transcriptional regulator [Dactylosporangium]|uniref:TetR family transcriptional regulator n=2 Tax=Dactylosporangium TaxID=35753 RepID=A0A9W6KKZ7_9ACTN|nr:MULTISPECIES: TetR/AcrR family transcriptional regulator [Dactylosporangium]UAC01172.1 TetR/AcrR family transcriptional regulator [Dactylosporangium vinaceum]UWZ48730.1 TetR/AcrR family transcriptional regulator [Dactylosporangium matsuzakiense]GLL03108.1 TetR family transcriptional regulator [Dactylosporangium matsuzakiense]